MLAALALFAPSQVGEVDASAEAANSTQEAPAKTTLAGRLAADLSALEASLERGREDALHQSMLDVVSKALEGMGEQPFAPSTLGGVKRKELELFRAWNVAGAEGETARSAKVVGDPDHFPTMLRSYARALESLGVELLIVPVPLRLQVYPEHLVGISEQADFKGYGGGFTASLHGLAESGVQVLDLLPAFAEARHTHDENSDARLYLDYDLHWSPRGVILAADLVAQRIRSSDWFVPGPLRADQDFFVRREKGKWSIINNRKLELDVARKPVDVWFEKVLMAEGRSGHVKDPKSPILLMGDSFSGLYKREAADMASLLCARLGRRIDVISLSGGGSSLWKALDRRGKQGVEGKRIVIWMCSMLDFNRKHSLVPLFED